eukprot:216253-Rhodomonas_salina.1
MDQSDPDDGGDDDDEMTDPHQANAKFSEQFDEVSWNAVRMEGWTVSGGWEVGRCACVDVVSAL